MNKFWTWLGGVILILLLTVLVSTIVYNNNENYKNWVDGWSTPKQEQPAEDENNNENGEDENITPDEPTPDVNEDENQEEPETNLQFFVFENDYAKILIAV